MARSTADPFDGALKRRKRSTVKRKPAGQSASEPEPVQLPQVPQTPFTTAKHQQGLPRAGKLRHGFEEVVLDLFKDGFDAHVEFEAVVEGLEIQGALTPEAIKRAANRQEKLADRAFRLYIAARREVNAYKRETEPIVGAIREAAVRHLELEKRTMVDDGNGKKVSMRSKQITDADVAAACAQLYPDEWSEVQDRRDKAELMLKELENLAALARSRAYTASSMLQPGRRAG